MRRKRRYLLGMLDVVVCCGRGACSVVSRSIDRAIVLKLCKLLHQMMPKRLYSLETITTLSYKLPKKVSKGSVKGCANGGELAKLLLIVWSFEVGSSTSE